MKIFRSTSTLVGLVAEGVLRARWTLVIVVVEMAGLGPESGRRLKKVGRSVIIVRRGGIRFDGDDREVLRRVEVVGFYLWLGF